MEKWYISAKMRWDDVTTKVSYEKAFEKLGLKTDGEKADFQASYNKMIDYDYDK